MRPRFPLYLKITGASFLVVLVVLAFVAFVTYRAERRALEDKFGLTLQHIAQTAAPFLDGDAHDRVRTDADAPSADFRGLRGVLERVRRENQLKEDQLYTLRPLADGQIEFVLMLQAKTFVASKMRLAPEADRVARATFADGQPRYTHIYTDENGSFVSGFAPVRTAGGRVVGVLEADFGVDQFLAELKTELRKKLWMVPASLALAFALSLFVAYSITKAVKQLMHGTSEVSAGRYDVLVDVPTRDELHTLAESFNQMLGGLRERFAMLKFVPRHTRQVIADSVRGKKVESLAGLAQTRDVAIFFSDIRGFTPLSDKLGPQRVIEMLNIYLRKEAEIIERNHGSIDKFIGDAVMAVFEGPERIENAVRSAVEIQLALRLLNEQKAFVEPIEVGIGIAGGEVVMGSVGYEDRLEFAVIGRLVNLASRFTSIAGRGEVVISEMMMEKVAHRYSGERIDGLQLKGFAGPVSAYKLKLEPPKSATV